MIQRFYPANWYYLKNEQEIVQECQQGWNLRPDKPFYDVPDEKKGYAG